ncbi:MAG: hypothetical protein LBK61_07085 [Spirochaetaceae bacterium]|nr:hypothetical protein [Spirochaetaceae bacterium]
MSTPLRSAPAGGENPQGFHPFVKPIPNSGRKNSGMAGISPPYGGIAHPKGKHSRRKGVICLPRRCRIGERMNKRDIYR